MGCNGIAILYCVMSQLGRQEASFVDHFCHLCFVFVMPSCFFIAAMWSPAEKGLTFWLAGI